MSNGMTYNVQGLAKCG